jgi:hypothetical protein
MMSSMLWCCLQPKQMMLAVLLLLGSLCCFCFFPPQGQCQDEFEVEQEPPFWLRGLLDVRVVRGGSASSWTDRGTGKARYGGRTTEQGLKRVTRLALSQFALEAGGVLPWGIVPHAQLNWEPDISNDDRPLLIEAYLRKEWGAWEKGWGLQTGVMNIPFSLEHTGPAATPLYTLTPSALNSWIWEEARLVGVEGEWWQVITKEIRFSILAGMGFGSDEFGRMLALLGWVLSDYLTGINSDLPLPARGQRMAVFNERDHRPALYTLFTLQTPQDWGEFLLGYFDNLGDQGTEGVWETRFGTVGTILRPLARVEFLSQYMIGTGRVRERPTDISFSAFYALLSFHYYGHRFSARYDVFRTSNRDGPPAFREHGDGVTFAYLFAFGLHHRVSFEYLFLHSHRPSVMPPSPSDSGWQLSYRFRY